MFLTFKVYTDKIYLIFQALTFFNIEKSSQNMLLQINCTTFKFKNSHRIVYRFLTGTQNIL